MQLQPELLALIASVSAALMYVCLRYAVQRGVDALAYSFWASFLGGIVLLCTLPSINLFSIEWSYLALLFIAGVLWALSVLFDTKSFADIDAIVNALLDSLRFFCLVLAGVVFFGENIGLQGAFGLFLILVSIFWGVPVLRLSVVPGFWFRIYSVFFGLLALLLDKYLTTVIDSNFVILSGFLTPAFVYFVINPQLLLSFSKQYTKGRLSFLLAVFFFLITGYTLVSSFGYGELSTTVIIYRSRLILVFLLGALLLHEREQLMKRGVASLLCFAGIVLTVYDS